LYVHVGNHSKDGRHTGKLLGGTVQQNVVRPSIAWQGHDGLVINAPKQIEQASHQHQTQGRHGPRRQRHQPTHVKGGRQNVVSGNRRRFQFLQHVVLALLLEEAAVDAVHLAPARRVVDVVGAVAGKVVVVETLARRARGRHAAPPARLVQCLVETRFFHARRADRQVERRRLVQF